MGDDHDPKRRERMSQYESITIITLSDNAECFLPLFLKFLQEPTATLCRKKKGGGCARGWCVRRESLLQDRLPAKFQDVKFAVPKCKHEIFMRIDMNHSFFSNYFIICLQSCC